MNQLKQIHGFTLRNGIDYCKTLIVRLLQIPNIPYAHNLFDLIPAPTVFLYNKLIQAYASEKQPCHCLSLYSQMRFRNCLPDQHTFASVFAACACFSSPLHGQTLHTHFLKSGYDFHAFALTALVDMYAKLGKLAMARKVFDEITFREIPIWNALIAGYFRCGDMERALDLFKVMPDRNVVSWTAMISGYSQNGQYAKALEMFLWMEKEKDVKPNEVTIASVLSVCANLGALKVGERVEAYAKQNGLLKDLYVTNALLEMYARCGKIDAARHLFDEIIGKRRNLCSWNSMIMGLAIHGRSNDAIQLYGQMLRKGTAPDDVTFVALLVACTHGGMVIKGRQIFQSMHKFGVTSKLEHYGCMVDLLGRAGELNEAYNLIRKMPMKPDAVVWGTILGACSFHKIVELAEIAAEALFELEPWNPGNYVILSNIYASAGCWDRVAKLRKKMKGGQLTKAAGYSVIEDGRGGIQKFIAEDLSHPKIDEIYGLLNEISTKMMLQNGEDFESELAPLSLME